MTPGAPTAEKLLRRSSIYDVVASEEERFHRKRLTASGSIFRDRFLEEAAEMPRVRHPNILSVFGLDESLATPCQEIEPFDGHDLLVLEGLLATASPADEDEGFLLALLHEIARGLEAAHSSGVSHGFLGPGSVLVSKSGLVKLTDFRLGADRELPETLGGPKTDLARLPFASSGLSQRLGLGSGRGPGAFRRLAQDLGSGHFETARSVVERCANELGRLSSNRPEEVVRAWLAARLSESAGAQDTRARPAIAKTPEAPDLESVKSTIRMRPLSGLALEGRYEIKERIGSGGMGTVYRAVQLAVGRDVALKTVLAGAEGEMGPEVFGRFENEARIVSQLRHPNTLRLFDFGRLDGGELYLVTELLHGETLEERLRRGPFEPREALRFLAEIADALHEAHGKGIVHRDIKPRNLFIDRVGDRDIFKILDFGLAKLAGLPAHTRAGYILGSPTYMSPEQTEGEEAGPPADLYSLGVTAFEMLAGRPPFVSSDPRSLLLKHRHDPPPRFSELRPPVEVPEELEAIVLRMLAKDPADRPSSAAALREELEALGASLDRSSSSGGASKRTSPEGTALIGTKIQNYRIEGLLGEGVASRVFAAEHEVLGRSVAVKVLTSLALRQTSTHQRLRREARVLAQLRHPSIVEVLDFGVQDDGAPYMVLERIHGRTLKQVLAESGPIAPERVRSWLAQISRALVLAHGKGVVHRDLKLSNAMLLDDASPETIKVLDFGLARFIDPEEEGTKITKQRMLLGTPGYMSPEQIETPSAVGPAADLYALGCMGYALLAGHLPFRGPVADVLDQQRNRMPAPLPPSMGLEQIILRLLQKRPENRPASAAQVLASLEALAAQHGEEDTFPNEPSLTPAGLYSDAERTELHAAPALNEPPSPPRPRAGPRPGAADVPVRVVEVATGRSRLPELVLAGGLVVVVGVGAAVWKRANPERLEIARAQPTAPVRERSPVAVAVAPEPTALPMAEEELEPETTSSPAPNASRRRRVRTVVAEPAIEDTTAQDEERGRASKAKLETALHAKGLGSADLAQVPMLRDEVERARAALARATPEASREVENAIESVRAFRPDVSFVKRKLERVGRVLGEHAASLPPDAVDVFERRYFDLGQALSAAVLPSELDRLLQAVHALERDLQAQRRGRKSP